MGQLKLRVLGYKSAAPSAPDLTPNTFSFGSLVTGATPGAQVRSPTIYINGLSPGASTGVSIVGGVFSKNGGTDTAASTTAQNGDSFSVAVNSNTTSLGFASVTLTVGGVSATFMVQTRDAGTFVTTQDEWDGALNAAIAANGGTITIANDNTIETFAIPKNAKPLNTIYVQGEGAAYENWSPVPDLTIEEGATRFTFNFLNFYKDTTSGKCIASSTSKTNRTGVIIIDYCEIGGAWLDPQASYAAGTVALGITRVGIDGRYDDIWVKNCYIHDLIDGYKPLAVAYRSRVHFNYISRCYADFIHNGVDATGPAIIEYIGNLIVEPLAKLTDTGSPHSDARQTTFNGLTGVVQRSFVDRGNIVCDMFPREAEGGTGTHHALLGASASTFYAYLNMLNLSFCREGASHAPSAAGGSGAAACYNRCLRIAPGDFGASTVTAIAGTSQPGGLPNAVYHNVGEIFSATGGGSIASDNYHVDNSPEGHAGTYANDPVGYSMPTRTYADLVALKVQLVEAARLQDDHPLAWLNDAYNYWTDEISDPSLFRPFAPVPNKIDQEPDTYILSGWCKLQLGGMNQPYTLDAGTAIQFASDSSGTAATSFGAEGASGTINQDTYYQLRRTSNADWNGNVSWGITVSGVHFGGLIITRSQTAFPKVNTNYVAQVGTTPAQGGRLIASTIPSVTNQQRFIFLYRGRWGRLLNFMTAFAQGNSGAAFKFQQRSGFEQFVFDNDIFDIRNAAAADMLMHTNIFIGDMSEPDPLKAFVWLKDGVRQTFTNLNFEDAPTGVATIINTSNGTAKFNPNLILSSLAIGAEADGGGQLDGDLEAIWLDGGTASYPLPADPDDPEWQKLFSPDLIGSRGQGPTGADPWLYRTLGPASTVNAPMPNLSGPGNGGVGWNVTFTPQVTSGTRPFIDP